MLVYGSPDAPMPQVGRPVRIAGRLHLNPTFQAATANIRFSVVNQAAGPSIALQGWATVSLNAANEASFSGTARNGGVELQSGRNVVFITIELPPEPTIPRPMIRIRLD